MSAHTLIRVGTSGWNYPHWRGRFYPAELPQPRWFEHYSGLFDTVEINNTFYHLPEPKTFDGWRGQAPAGFLYAVKANRFLTHLKKLKEPARPLRKFLQRARRLGSRLGPILYQLPPHWKPNLDRLERFCALLPRELTHVMEFREAAWLSPETFELLTKHHVCLCIHDLLERHPREITGPAAYVRFHGSGQRYGGGYPRPLLRQWADWLHATAAAGHGVYVYFNNDAEAHAIRDAMSLREMLR